MSTSTTRRSSIVPSENTTKRAPPTTPGTKVRHLTAELQTKETENEALRKNLDSMTQAFDKLALVKPTAVPSDTKEDDDSKKKKKKSTVVPAKTAYKFWCEAQPHDSENLQQRWKETAAPKRAPYVALSKADKERFAAEQQAYDQEQKALAMYREQQKQQAAMAFYEAHLEAQAVKEQVQEENGKKKKKKKDPDAPKRVTSSYIYFSQEMRPSVVEKNSQAKVTEVSKILGEMWKELDETKKAKYEDMAAVDRERYAKEKEAYDALVNERKLEEERANKARLEQEKKDAMELMESQSIQIRTALGEVHDDDVSMLTEHSGKAAKKKKDPNAPKRALSAYNYFVSENREAIKSKMPAETKNAEIFAEVGKAWKALSEKKKEKYAKMAAKDQERFAKEMEAYTAQQKTN